MYNIGFQDPATPVMEGIVDLHNYIFFFLILIFILVSWVFLGILYDFYFRTQCFKSLYMYNLREESFSINNITHFSQLELIWTLTPSIILILIAIPSFALLYAMDEVLNPALTFKAIGHQWYWSYEFSDYNSLEPIIFDSNLVPESELLPGEFRLLTTDNAVVLPTNVHIRVIITSMDVLHSWAVPSLGVKLDACPGRLNQTFLFIKREGVFYGQCSELCGVNHGFMPIMINAVELDTYLEFLNNFSESK